MVKHGDCRGDAIVPATGKGIIRGTGCNFDGKAVIAPIVPIASNTPIIHIPSPNLPRQNNSITRRMEYQRHHDAFTLQKRPGQEQAADQILRAGVSVNDMQNTKYQTAGGDRRPASDRPHESHTNNHTK